MKTIKVIDLLNKIANGEEVPKKYRYKNEEYEEDYCLMLYEATGNCNELGFKSLLNDEVEIIEDKKIEHIGIPVIDGDNTCNELMKSINVITEDNEVIDKINEMSDKEWINTIIE